MDLQEEIELCHQSGSLEDMEMLQTEWAYLQAQLRLQERYGLSETTEAFGNYQV